jgi:hypothetical protein
MRLIEGRELYAAERAPVTSVEADYDGSSRKALGERDDAPVLIRQHERRHDVADFRRQLAEIAGLKARDEAVILAGEG